MFFGKQNVNLKRFHYNILDVLLVFDLWRAPTNVKLIFSPSCLLPFTFQNSWRFHNSVFLWCHQLLRAVSLLFPYSPRAIKSHGNYSSDDWLREPNNVRCPETKMSNAIEMNRSANGELSPSRGKRYKTLHRFHSKFSAETAIFDFCRNGFGGPKSLP